MSSKSRTPKPLLLSERHVRAVLPMADLIEAMEHALVDFSSGRVLQPVRQVLDVGEEDIDGATPGMFAVMPAVLNGQPADASHAAGRRAVGAKLVTVYPGNHDHGLPSHLATIILLDHATGGLLALVDGRYITEARTAAVSAVSVKHLARPEASVLALVGSGVQAHSHLEAIRHVRRLSDVRVWSPTGVHRHAFADEASASTGLPVRAMATASEAVRGADIIVLVTGSRVPVIASEDVAEGAHVCAVGACRPDQREMPTSLVARARVYVDSRSAALKESGDLLLPMGEGAITERHILAELGELPGRPALGRQAPGDVTVFKSLGLAVEDVVAASLVVDRARTAHLGKPFELGG